MKTAVSRIRGTTLQNIRKRHFAQNPMCVMCAATGRVTLAAELDHILSLYAGGTDTSDNRQGLCTACHQIKTAADIGFRPRPMIGADGWPTDAPSTLPSGPRWRWEERASRTRQSAAIEAMLHPAGLRASAIPLTVVCGPAGGGKSTYVSQHARADDTVIDMDMIRAELRIGPDQWTQETLARSLKRRNELLKMFATARKGEAWFIVSAAPAQEREWWLEALKPKRLVVVLADADTCIQRIRSSRTGDRAERAIRAARQWWQNYTPSERDDVVSTIPGGVV